MRAAINHPNQSSLHAYGVGKALPQRTGSDLYSAGHSELWVSRRAAAYALQQVFPMGFHGPNAGVSRSEMMLVVDVIMTDPWYPSNVQCLGIQ